MRCVNVLINLGIIEAKDRGKALIFIANSRQAVLESIRGDGNFSNGISCNKSRRIQYFMLLFYGMLKTRCDEVRDGKAIEIKERSRQSTHTREKAKIAPSVLCQEDKQLEIETCSTGASSATESKESSSDHSDRSVGSVSSDDDSLSSDEGLFDNVTLQMEKIELDNKNIDNSESSKFSTKMRLRLLKKDSGSPTSLAAQSRKTGVRKSGIKKKSSPISTKKKRRKKRRQGFCKKPKLYKENCSIYFRECG